MAFDFENDSNLFDIISFCCNEYDLSTPVVLDKHKKYFNEFSLVKFFKDDFIEPISYDAVEVEIFE